MASDRRSDSQHDVERGYLCVIERPSPSEFEHQKIERCQNHNDENYVEIQRQRRREALPGGITTVSPRCHNPVGVNGDEDKAANESAPGDGFRIS